MQTIDKNRIENRNEPRWLQLILIGIALLFLFVFLILPVSFVLYNAFGSGLNVYLKHITTDESISAITLTLLVVLISVPLNTIFGFFSAWLFCHFQFPGKALLASLVDLPFSVSPVISGLIFVLLFGLHGWFGEFLDDVDVQVIFAVPGIVIATLFVTFPFVTRELLSVMEMSGKEEEEAAISLGAKPWQVFWYVTLPKIKWGLFYGIILCNARAMGEFGAVSVVSGHIRGYTNTMPLHIEILYNEYNYIGAFAVASLLTFTAIITLIVKSIVEWKKKEA